MSQRAVFMLQILERLGAPLLAAVCEVAARQAPSAAPAPPREAERLAELLAKSVQAGVDLSAVTALKDGGDSGRLALTSLAAGLIGGQYRQTGRMPDEAEIKRLVTALEAVMTFADNFTAAAENTLRLQGMEPGFFPADEDQIHVQYLGAFVPVVGAVSAFSFGRQEKKLLQEVASRLCAQAASLREAVPGTTDDKAARLAELRILKGLAILYAQCHFAETQRLMTMDEAGRAQAAQADGTLSLDPVWKALDLRVSMLEMLAGSVLPDHLGAAGGMAPAASASAPPVVSPFDTAPAAAPVSPPPAAPAAPAAPPPRESAPADAAKVAPETQENYNPMSFFKPGSQKPADDTADQ